MPDRKRLTIAQPDNKGPKWLGFMKFAQRFSRHADKLYRRIHWRARAHQVAIAIRIINASDGWPEFVIFQPWRRKGRLLAGIFVRPVVAADYCNCVWSAFNHVISSIILA